MSSKFLDKTGLNTLWAKIKSTFQTLGNLVTAWGSTPSDTKYPSEKLVKNALDGKAPNTPSEVTIATGDKPLIADSSDSNKVKRASISFDTGVTNTFLLRNGTFATVRERDLGWGGNFCTSKSPTEAFTTQNSFFYPKPSAVKVEYSNNRTAETPTWTDYGLTDTQKQSLFSGNEGAMSVYCGAKQHVHPGYTGIAPYKDLSNDNVADQGLRITIACRSLSNRSADTDYWIYCYLRGILLNMSTQSAGGGAHCVVEKQNGTQYKADSSEWVTLGDYKIQGDTGWNSIPFDGAFGGVWTQTSNYSWVIRFTIWSDKLNATPNSGQTGCLKINAIAGINHIVWYATNPVQRTGLPFSYSYDGTMTLMKPLPIASGGTGATTAIGAEYNILNQVADIDTTIDGNRKIALCNQTKSASNGVFRWLKLSNVWTWIKGLLSSESGVNISGNAATATNASKVNNHTVNADVPSGAVFTDTKVKATAKTDNVNYKILATASASPTSGSATEAVYDTDVTLNPSTNTISANISGTATEATNALNVNTAIGNSGTLCLLGVGNNVAGNYQARIHPNIRAHFNNDSNGHILMIGPERGTGPENKGAVRLSAGTAYFGSLKPADLTADRSWILPDGTGTIALTGDIPSGTQLVYDCGTGSTSGTDFDNALAAFNAGRWVIIRNLGSIYYCVGTYNSGLRFKRLANDTTILKVDTLNWTRGSAPTAGTPLEAALVGHTHSNYVPTSRKINGKTLDADITLTSTDVAAASVGPSNSSKDWIELGTFQYNDSIVMYAGLTLAVQFRANDGRNESGILWISTGEYKASGGYSNADVVATFSTISRRSVDKTERFALYFNSLGTTSTSGVKLYAKVQSYSSVYVTPVNAVKGSWVPSMTYLDSEPATKVEVSYYALLKSTPGSGIGGPSTPVYVDAYGQVIPCSGETATAASKTDWSATARIARRQTYVYAPVGWSIGTSAESGYDTARHITLAESGNFPGLDLRATAFRTGGNLDFSLRGRTDQIVNSWLSGAQVYHCGKVVVRSANTTDTVTRIYSEFSIVGAGGVLKFAFCDPSFPSSSYTQYGTWEGSMIINPNIVGGLSIRISFNMVFRIESSDNNAVIMGGRFHIESDGDVQFVYS